MFNLPLTKSAQQRKTSRHCRTRTNCQYWMLRLVASN